jgi:hypothetical protein
VLTFLHGSHADHLDLISHLQEVMGLLAEQRARKGKVSFRSR